MFFLRGQTDNKILEDKNVRIWTQNTTRGFLDGRGLHHLAEGDMGATYGFLFRHHGARYIDCKTDYAGQGFDQLREVIRLLKEDPYSRRIIINLWDPSSMCNMSLPPCAYNYQFYVDFVGGRKLLTCKLTQRSSDISLAGGWNIASAALLTYMLARCTGMEPARLIWSTGDTHIYLNQLDGVAAQLSREPRCFPKLYFSGPIKEITDYEFGDLILANYNPHPTIKMVMNP
jgi:thymidylate synthase